MRKLILGLILAGLVTLGIVFAASSALPMMAVPDACATNTLFDEFHNDVTFDKQVRRNEPATYVDKAGNIAYLFENFRAYANNQYVIDSFEKPESWKVNDEMGKLQLSNEYYGGTGALALAASSDLEKIVLSNEARHNLSRWDDVGYITMWLNVANPDSIDTIGITFEDGQGNTRNYTPLENVHTFAPNTFANDPDYPDLVYPEGDPTRDMWVDFVLEPGWNYLLWRADTYQDEGDVNLSNIRTILVNVQVDEVQNVGELIFDDLRIQDGLQKSSNPTGGTWFPPHGRPQYGVYDIDKNKDGSGYDLRLLNVKNKQYPSNGDHARMISSAPVPSDFVMRVKFTMIQLGNEDESLRLPSPFPAWTPSEVREIPITAGLRNNTYFRVTYDFEPSWDPGHDWFGAYLSLQYGRLGLTSVWPIERNVLQDQEPKSGSRTATTEFVPQDNVEYEMHLLAKGQFLSSTIYEVIGDDCLGRKAGMSYTFDHPRYGLDKRYPLAIESTGNMRTIIHEVEITTLDKDATSDVKRIS